MFWAALALVKAAVISWGYGGCTICGLLLETIDVGYFSCSACSSSISQKSKDDVDDLEGVVLFEEDVGYSVVSFIDWGGVREELFVRVFLRHFTFNVDWCCGD
jgi:hypothetical protein